MTDEQRKKEMIALLGKKPSTTLEEFKAGIIAHIDARSNEDCLTTQMAYLNRKFGKASKGYDTHLNEILAELIEEGKAFVYRAQSGASVVVSEPIEEALQASLEEDPLGKGFHNVINNYRKGDE